MAICITMEFSGAGQAQYDAALRDLDLDGNPPPGGRIHIAGPMEGGWKVVDVWDSQEQLDTFVQSRLGAILQKHGIPQPSVSVFPVHNTWQPSVAATAR